MPGVTPPVVRSLFQAAAAFYRATPWKKARVVRIDRPAWPTWYAALTGKSRTTPGLVLAENLATARRIQQGTLSDRKSSAASMLAVLFGSKRRLAPSDLEMVQQYQLPVAGPRAYPLLVCQEPGVRLRQPFDSEVQLLDGCLRALSRLPAGEKAAGPFEMQVPLPSGAVQFQLAPVH
jgi:hypothetical protein